MTLPTRDDLAAEYIEQLEYDLYPVQEEALLAWFTSEQGVLVCAPTGTGKTLIAEAAMFEALRLGQRAYYTTPLIALTDQKFHELQERAVDWGFSPNEVGLVTGNRRVNPDARVLVVVAEILFNRLLHPSAFDFEDVSAVVMDEFHSFNDPERGVVWELSLGLLAAHVRTLLLSATVGNAFDFVSWLRRCHNRKLELVQSDDRKVPLTFQWVGDRLLSDHIEEMASGEDENRRVPSLLFCFNRDECWSVAEQLKGKKLLRDGQQKQLASQLEQYKWSEGAGPKLRQLLLRGVGVHHAGLLPKYRRVVESLFQEKLLSVAVCTETLSAGINLPARSVVMPTLMKGPAGRKKLIEPSSAHQMFGRAGRPQFDAQGFVYALAHEDDVRLARWREKFDQIPEDTKDPGLLKQRKALKKKMPKRRSTEAYWTQVQFEKLRDAPASDLASRGPLPWRLLAWLLDASPDVDLIRQLISKRLLSPNQLEQGQRELDRMLMTMWRAGYVELEPEPPREDETADAGDSVTQAAPEAKSSGLFGNAGQPEAAEVERRQGNVSSSGPDSTEDSGEFTGYRPQQAHATDLLDRLLHFRGVNPLYGVFLINQLGIADQAERLQAMESVLEMPGTVARYVRVPRHDDLPPGPLATTRLDIQLLQLGLASEEQLVGRTPEDEEDQRDRFFRDEPVFVLTLADKLKMLFEHDFKVHDVRITSVWVAGELLEFGGDFNKYIGIKKLQKQEGIIFRHLLRLILLMGEFRSLVPPDVDPSAWESDLDELADRLAESCRQVDPSSTDKALQHAREANELRGQM